MEAETEVYKRLGAHGRRTVGEMAAEAAREGDRWIVWGHSSRPD